jgi:hypothetical protein
VALRVGLAPLLIGLVTIAGRRWGPTTSGLLVGLPLTSGPIVFLLSIMHGSEFGVNTSAATLAGLIALVAFCVGYARSAFALSWPLATLIGWGSYGSVGLCLVQLHLPLAVVCALAVSAIMFGLVAVPRTSESSASHADSLQLWPRAVTATLMVLLLTGVGGTLGPRWSGLISPFPVYATIATTSMHFSRGASASLRVLRGVLIGSFSFCVFFTTVAMTLEKHGIGFSFGTSVVLAIGSHALLISLGKGRWAGSSESWDGENSRNRRSRDSL